MSQPQNTANSFPSGPIIIENAAAAIRARGTAVPRGRRRKLQIAEAVRILGATRCTKIGLPNPAGYWWLVGHAIILSTRQLIDFADDVRRDGIKQGLQPTGLSS